MKGYSDEIREKMGRLCDLLDSIEKSEFLSKRLSLYGGTAMNFIYLGTPRLSEDIDFNYRHNDDKDWGEVRDKIDGDLKWIIKSLGYKDEKLNINPKYNQCRFHMYYTSDQDIENDIKIEVGYMRRIPDLKEDTFQSFKHLTKDEKIEVMTPKKEELFANKFSTMISRSKTYLNPRDVFDVHSISTTEFEYDLFLELVSLEAILMGMKYSDLLEVKEHLEKGKLSGKIEHLVKDETEFDEIILNVIAFYEKILNDLSSQDLNNVIDGFHSSGELSLDKFKFKEELHPQLSNHPQLQWLRNNR